MGRGPQLLAHQREAIQLYREHGELIWLASRQSGKTTGIACQASLDAVRGQSSTVMSASMLACRTTMRRIGYLIAAIVPTARVHKMHIEIPGRAIIQGVAANARTARSFTGHLYMDEADWYADPEAIWGAASPIASRAGWRIMLTSTPKCEGSWLDNMIKEAVMPVYRTDIYQAVANGVPQDIAKLRRRTPDPNEWAANYEIKFISARSIFFDLDSTCAAQTHLDPPIGHVYGGIDVGRKHDRFVFSAVSKCDGRIYLLDQLVLHDVSYDVMFAESQRFYERWRPYYTLVDSSLMGGPLYEAFDKLYPGHFAEVRGPGSQSTQRELVARLKAGYARKDLIIPCDPELIKDHRLVRRNDQGLIVTEREKGRGHADRVWSFAYAVHAAETGPVPYDLSGGRANTKQVIGDRGKPRGRSK